MNRILLAALLISLAGCQQSPAQAKVVQHFQLSTAANGNAWKIDTETGTTWLCTPTEIAKINLGSTCTVSKDANEMPSNR